MSTCCSNILNAQVTNCGTDDSIRVNMFGVAALDDLSVTVTDRFGNKYAGVVTSDDNHILIPKANFPAGIFDVPGTTFTIERGVGNRCGNEKFIIASAYDAIQLEIIGGTNIDREVGCQLECDAIPVP